ncbi:MAG: acetyl-CoA carboxylase biotin carboxyl carrier protein subunit, partial [Acidimicrobiales bacterium]|nr:acetyl-CoA carboxylase biotin carboxyl carrier protein subunit [Acidimicrobiales bacterium]
MAEDFDPPETHRLVAPMAGTVSEVAVAEGDGVVAGQTVVVLEVMKMEHPLTVGLAGHVEGLRVAVGDAVAQGDELLRVVGTGRSAEEPSTQPGELDDGAGAGADDRPDLAELAARRALLAD